MTNLLKLMEQKISPKYLIYLKENDYKMFKNVEKEESSISTHLIDNKIFEVLEITKKNGEILYLIGVDNNELGWVAIDNPILILNSLSERVAVNEHDNNNELNDVLAIQNELKQGSMYTARYICNYNGTLYSGLENEDEFFGFYPLNILDFGNIEEIKFEFKNSMAKVYESEKLLKSQMIITDNQEYSTTKFYSNLKIGEIKIGKNYFWFKLDDTTLDQNKVVAVSKEFDEYYLEHLIQSIRIEKGLQVRGQVSTGGVNKEYVQSLNERTKQLKDKNEEHLELNRTLSKELKEKKLELSRRTSKVDYLDRLTTNQKKKLDYYEERNKKLEDRVELLEEKLSAVNAELKQLKNGKLIKIQSKFFGK